VIGTSRTRAKLQRAAELGLEHGVLAGDGDWAKAVLELTDGRGVDVILDLVGGPYLAGNQKAIASRGRMIVVGTTGGPKAEIDLRVLMGKRATMVGTVMRARPIEQKIVLARTFADRVVPAFAAGQLRPVIDGLYPPEQAADAHRRMEENETFGKLLIVWE
jgi:NADPH:quinone reductase